MRPEELPPVAGDSPVLGALRSGQMVADRFRLDRFLGKGGMGVVWSARDEVLRKERALKFLSDNLAHDAAAKADLADEVARCQELTHAHILRVHDFVEDKANALVAVSMELVTGGTLSARRVTEPHRWIEPEQLLPWVEQLCAALTYAHEEAGIVHRDLKPSNLLLDGRDRLKLADFGISQALTAAMTRATRRSLAFSLPYASPEQLLGQHSTAAQDLYSLGATLYEMLTGKPPFYQGDISHQTMHRVPDSIVSRRMQLENVQSTVPEVWEEVISELLRKNPANRPSSAREVIRRLTSTRSHPNAIAGGTNFGSPKPEPSAALPPVPPVRRRGSLPLAKDPVLASLSGPAAAATLPLLDARRKRPVASASPDDPASAKPVETPSPGEGAKHSRFHRQRLVMGAGVALLVVAAAWGGQKLLRPATPQMATHGVAVPTPPPATPAVAKADVPERQEKRIAPAATPPSVSTATPAPMATPLPLMATPAPMATPPPAVASAPPVEAVAEAAPTTPAAPVKPAPTPVPDRPAPPNEEISKPVIRLLIGKSVAKLKSGGFKLLQCSYIDDSGKNEIKVQGDDASEWAGGSARLKLGGKWSLIDAQGQQMGAKWDEMRDFVEDRAAVSQEGKWGFIDRHGVVVVPPQWEEAGPFSQGRARVRVGRSRSYIDAEGKLLAGSSWDEAWRFFEGRGAVMSKGHWGFVDLGGKLIIPAIWDEVNVFSEGMARVRKGNKWGFIDVSGKVVVPPQWDGALDFSEGMARVRKGGQLGFINETGKVAIALRFQDAGSFSGGLVDARLNGKCGYLRSSGEWALAPQWQANRVFVRGLAPVNQGGGWGVIDRQGGKRVETEWDDISIVEPLVGGPVFIRAIRKGAPTDGCMAYFNEGGSEIWRGKVTVGSGEM